MAKRGMLFVVSGPAGAGKSEIVKGLLRMHPDVKLSVSCTTRAPRTGEIDGGSYHFKTKEEFQKLVDEGAFYEWAFVHQNFYGTLKSTVEEELDAGHDLILEIDVQGFGNVKRLSPEAIGVFVSPPSRANLEKRLRGRGTETEDSIRVRLNNVASEVEKAYGYDYVIVHRDWADVPNALEIATDELYAIICAERIRAKNQTEFLDQLTADLKY